MKHILETILSAESEISDRCVQAQNEAQEMINESKRRVIELEKEYDADFNKEREDKNAALLKEVAEYEADWKKKTQKECESFQELLNQKREVIQERVLDIILKA